MTQHRIALLLACLILASLLCTSPVAGSDPSGPPIRLQFATFDPLQAEPDLPVELRASTTATPAPYLVQLTGPVDPAWPGALEAAGARLLGYVPEFAYLAWMDGPTRERVAGLPMVRWVGPYHPAYKLSPDLEGYAGQVRVDLFPVEEEPRSALAHAESSGLVPGVVTTTTLALFLDEAHLPEVAAWPEVAWIQPQRLPRLHNDQAAAIIGALPLWQRGYTGAGQMVALADSGLDSGVDNASVSEDMHPDLDNRVAGRIDSWPVAQWNYVGCSAVNQGANDGAADLASGHGTHVAGTAAGNGAASAGTYRGMAPASSLAFQALEQWTDWEGPNCSAYGYTDGYYLTGIPASLSLLFSQASSWGARIHSNSWGYAGNGDYAAESRDVDQFVWNNRSMTILFSAGNNGCDGTFDPQATQPCSGLVDGYVDEDSLDYPASAKNAIAVGASESWRPVPCPNSSCRTWGYFFPGNFPGNPTRGDLTANSKDHVAAISSRGPASDGRIKPDLVAPGTWIASIRSRWSSDPGLGEPINASYKYNLGTSMATAVAAGAVADLRQYYMVSLHVTNPSAALLKATLLNTAVDLQGYGSPAHEAGQPTPNNHEGWGRLNLAGATSPLLAFADGLSLFSGGVITKTYYVGTPHIPLRVTAVWSDYPALVGAAKALVNDLDLEVIAPNGTRYRGNAGLYPPGTCLRDGLWDSCNNVERVVIDRPISGVYKVVIRGYNVPQSPQLVALVATAGFGAGWDHVVYLPLSIAAPQVPPPCP